MNAQWRIFRGAQQLPAVPADDRGLAYGDGVFETMRAHAGVVPWWPAHWSRLAAGAQRLGIALPDAEQVRAEVADLLAGRSAVLKLQLTRGSGTRGYAPRADATPLWLLSLHPLPAPAPAACTLVWCQTRLARQPLLAGIKHCNRLEQVLARREVATAGADEGLVRDVAGRVTSGTTGNLFLLDDEGWHTPELGHAGIAGICRSWVCTQRPVRERRIRVDEVMSAQALFLCNSVRGILPVGRLDTRVFPPHPEVAALQRLLAAAHPAFASTGPA